MTGQLPFDRDASAARPVRESMPEAVQDRGRPTIFIAPGIAIGWCTGAPIDTDPLPVAANRAGSSAAECIDGDAAEQPLGQAVVKAAQVKPRLLGRTRR